MKLIYPGMVAHLVDGTPVLVTDVVSTGPAEEDQYLALATHGLFGADVLAPCTAVWRVDENVHLRLTPQDAERLPQVALAARPRYGAGRHYLWWSPA
jgi:hypothetical protein